MMKVLSICVAIMFLFIAPLQADISDILPMQENPKALPEIPFTNDADKMVSIADYQGKIIVLNFWATWCAPCRAEMPTLDNLQAELGGKQFQVLAMSVDRGGQTAIRKYFAKNDIQNLKVAMDKQGALGQGYGVQALPTTIVIDQQGRELSRLVGTTEWDTPEMITFFKSLIANQT